MPKTRRTRKVGGKRRKSMKGGFFSDMYNKTKEAMKKAHGQAMDSFQTIQASQQYIAGKNRLNDAVNTLQKHSNSFV